MNIFSQKISQLIGPSGSGKTVFARALASKHLNISYFGPEFNIFEGSILENIKIGRDISDTKITKIGKYFVPDLYERLDTVVNADTVSTGQMQRINLFRNVIDPTNENIILDEPLSNVNLNTYETSLKGINSIAKEYEVNFLIITHTISKKYPILDIANVKNS